MKSIYVQEFAINIIVQTYVLFIKDLGFFDESIVISVFMIYISTMAWNISNGISRLLHLGF